MNTTVHVSLVKVFVVFLLLELVPTQRPSYNIYLR